MASMYDRDPGDRETSVRPEALVAAAVLIQAISDCRGGRWTRVEDAEDAREFLAGHDGRLADWCALAGLRLEVVRELARQAVAEQPGPAERAGHLRALSGL